MAQSYKKREGTEKDCPLESFSVPCFRSFSAYVMPPLRLHLLHDQLFLGRREAGRHLAVEIGARPDVAEGRA